VDYSALKGEKEWVKKSEANGKRMETVGERKKQEIYLRRAAKQAYSKKKNYRRRKERSLEKNRKYDENPNHPGKDLSDCLGRKSDKILVMLERGSKQEKRYSDGSWKC